MKLTEHKLYLGKCDYNGSGKNNCEAYIIWALEDGSFSMQAEIWQPNKKDIYRGGQCVDAVAEYFPDNTTAQRMVEVWKRWHLNDMQAGSPSQRAWLEANPIAPKEYAYPKSHYDVVSAKLAEVGLNPDESGYKYGHSWLKEELPADIVAEIQS